MGSSDGSEIKRKTASNPSDQLEKLVRKKMKDKNFYLLAASNSAGAAMTHPEKAHGLFTYYFLEGIKGAEEAIDENGVVTVNSLIKFINLNCNKFDQHPITKTSSFSDMIIADHSK